MEGILKDSDGDVDGTSEVLEGVAEGAFVRAGVGGTGVKKLDLLLDLLLPPDVLLDLLLPPDVLLDLLLPPDVLLDLLLPPDVLLDLLLPPDVLLDLLLPPDVLLDLLLPPDVLLDLLLPPEDLLPPDLGLLLGTTIRLLGPRVRPFGTALSKAGLTTGRPVPGSRLNGRTPRGSRSSVNSCSTVAAILLGF